MELKVGKIGVIYDIKAGDFLADGSIYLKKDYVSEEEEKLQVKNKLNGMMFQSRIDKIISDYTREREDRGVEERSAEIEEYMKEKVGRRVEFIVFPETGVRGVDKVKMEETSILYITLSGSVHLGFLIDKTFAKLVIRGDEIGSVE